MRRNAAEKTHLALALRRFKEPRKSLPRPALIKRRLLLLSLPGPSYYAREEAVTISPDPDSKQQESFFLKPRPDDCIFLTKSSCKGLRDAWAASLIDCFVMLQRPAKRPQNLTTHLLLLLLFSSPFFLSVDRGANDFSFSVN